jgi:lambda repressor-like predicted transcriptional regulator
MIKHIVLWKLKEQHNGKTKDTLANEMTSRLLELKKLIPEIKFMEVGRNVIYPERNHDLVLVSEFNSFDDLELYANHPEHLKVVAFVKEIVTSRAAIDYEL